MKDFPAFERYGYQVIEQLGQNYQGGRFTYKARDIQSGQTVVIKQFRFAASKDWLGYKAVEREIDVLRSLNHPGIPRILASFDSSDGICLVQDYKDALPLSAQRHLTPQEIKSIAEAVLEILVYLQQQLPPIIHRDIKPENVLVDKQLNVYLIDFGLARSGREKQAALSSMAAGTFGFMPPEQLLNRPLTEASDLYGMGATLVCLLSGTPSTEIGNLIDSNFCFDFHSLPQLSHRFTEWLRKLVQPNLEARFTNAKAALDALKPLDVVEPEVKQSQNCLQFEQLPYVSFGLWFVVCCAGAVVVAAADFNVGAGAIAGAIIGVGLGVVLSPAQKKAWTSAIVGAVVGAVGGSIVGAGAKVGGVGGAVAGFVLVSAAAIAAIDVVSTAIEKQFNSARAIALLLLAAASGVGLGIGLSTEFGLWQSVLLAVSPLAGIFISYSTTTGLLPSIVTNKKKT